MIGLVVFLAACLATRGEPARSPSLSYTLQIDSTRPDVADVTIAFRGMPDRFHLAMKRHAEYDAKYWRYVSDVRVEPVRGRIERADSALWSLTVPGGTGVVRYRVHIQPAPRQRRAWMPAARSDGAFINPPDFFLYSPEATDVPVTLSLDVPRSWRVATALRHESGERYSAPNASTFLDTPVLLGALHVWPFVDHGVTYHVAYWPSPDGRAFDTTAFVGQLHRVASAAWDVFRGAPMRDFWFLLQDDADDALEHATSVTVGVRSVDLATNIRASLPEIAHEFFHTWNLVAIRPAGYNDLSYGPAARTPELWLGEGVTLYYANALLRRAGLTDSTQTLPLHLQRLYERYLGSPAILRTSPERASLAFDDSPIVNPDATGGYYLQGELLGNTIDALVRDSTLGARGLDEMMQVLFRQSRRASYRGYAPDDVRAAVDSACACHSSAFFERYVRGTGPIDIARAVSRLGLSMRVDTATVTDASGAPVPDLRVGIEFPDEGGAGELIVNNPESAWAIAGLRTGDTLVSINGATSRSFDDWRQTINGLRIGMDVPMIVRHGARREVTVPIRSFARARVRIAFGPRHAGGARTPQHD